MPAPPVSQGFVVYLERLDSIFIDAVHPKCFLCGLYLQATPDGRCVVLRGRNATIRLGLDCYNSFIVGVALFNDHQEDMRIFSNEIQ